MEGCDWRSQREILKDALGEYKPDRGGRVARNVA
jgi:hypothetical protein